MKSKLLTPALGAVLLATSALAMADNGRGHDHGGTSPQRHSAPHHWLQDARPAHYYGHPRWREPVPTYPGWHAPYHRHYSYVRGPQARHDDGVTIIFKGRID